MATSEPGPLHVYANDITEWFVADSAEEAAIIAEEHGRKCGMRVEEMGLVFEQVPDDRVLTIEHEVTRGGVHEGAVKKSMTCAEWAALNGKGFLATTEY